MRRLFVILPLLLLITLGACNVFSNKVDPAIAASLAQTQTTTLLPPTPIVTSVPKVAVIVNTFNSALRGADPLEETIDAKFTVTDVGLDAIGDPPVIVTLRVHVECEWISRPSCTTERAFIALAHIFERDGVQKKVMEQIPETVRVMQIRAFDHMQPIGVIEIAWQDLLAFTTGDITGDQLAARISRASQ